MSGVLALNVDPGSEYYPSQFEVPPDELFPNLTEYPDMAPVASVQVNSTNLYFHDGEEIFLLRNNWADPVSADYNWPVNPVDYGRGVIEWDWDVDFSTRGASMTVVCHTPERVEYMQGFFDRMRGAQGNFWMPTWEDDLPIAASIVGETYSLTVTATRTARLLLGNPIYQTIAVITHDNRVLTNSILTVDIVGDRAVLGLRDPWLEDIRADEVRMVSWMPAWRLTSDEMIFSWLTDTTAQVVLQCQTDKAQRYDPDDVANLRRAIIYTSQPYPLFFDDRLRATVAAVDASLRQLVIRTAFTDEMAAQVTVVEATLRQPLVDFSFTDEMAAQVTVVDGSLEKKLVSWQMNDELAAQVSVVDGSLE